MNSGSLRADILIKARLDEASLDEILSARFKKTVAGVAAGAALFGASPKTSDAGEHDTYKKTVTIHKNLNRDSKPIQDFDAKWKAAKARQKEFGKNFSNDSSGASYSKQKSDSAPVSTDDKVKSFSRKTRSTNW